MKRERSEEENEREDRSDKKSKNRRGVTWDEVNLEENEKLKIQMAIPKIPDPKTPWLSPGSVSDHDEPTDLAEFMLPNVAVALQGGAGPSGQPQLAVQATEQLMQNSGGGAGPGPSSMQRFSGSGEDRRSSGTVSHRSSSPNSAYYTSEDEEKVAERKAKFEEARKGHYNSMREAMARARALIEEEDEDEEGDDERGANGNGMSGH